MATQITSFVTEHGDVIHDAQFDYYGRFLATCSSDALIKIWEITDNSQKLISELKGHDAPVWQVAWSHPKYGKLLASCSYDRKVIIWRESNNKWKIEFELRVSQQSVNSIAWAPKDLGLMLACASSDGTITIISPEDHEWKHSSFHAHDVGCNSVSWAPITESMDNTPLPTLVTGGCDNLVKIWHQKPDQEWVLETSLEGHTDWVRDVSWSPNIGLPYSSIASCGQDGTVLIWTKPENSGNWNQQKLPTEFEEIMWRVSWSNTGNILSVCSGDSRVTLWKEGLEHDWICISNNREN